jgi:uncharacterized protein YbjT (DUF2867 family)
MNPENKEEIHRAIKESKGVIVIPPLENRPTWYDDMDRCFKCLEETRPEVAILISSAGVGAISGVRPEHQYHEVFKCMAEMEEKFKKVGSNKKWAILRKTVPQQYLLHYSRLIQETGCLMLPIGNGKCPYVSLDDVACAAGKLICNPPSSFHTYTLTGPEILDGQRLVEHLNRTVEANVEYQNISPQLAERYLRHELGEESIKWVYFTMGMLELIKNNKLDHPTDDVKKILGHEPRRVDTMLKEFAQLFKP